MNQFERYYAIAMACWWFVAAVAIFLSADPYRTWIRMAIVGWILSFTIPLPVWLLDDSSAQLGGEILVTAITGWLFTLCSTYPWLVFRRIVGKWRSIRRNSHDG